MADQRFRISSNVDGVIPFLTAINEKAVARGISQSIKRTITGGRTYLHQILTENEIVDPRKVSAALLKKRNMFKAVTRVQGKIDSDYGTFTVNDRRFSMKYYPLAFLTKGVNPRNKQPLTAVSARIYGRMQFIGRRVFPIRKGKNQQIVRRTSDKRGPLKIVFGPSLSQSLVRTGLTNLLVTRMQERFEKEVAHNVDYFISRI